jgi:hypothetical protein
MRKSVRKSTVVLDFDGVIHQYSAGWHDGTIYDPPVPGVESFITRLLEKYCVAVVTTRDPFQIELWFQLNFDFPVEVLSPGDKFWNTEGVIAITNRKVGAIAYIDDRSIFFDQSRARDCAYWEGLLQKITEFEPNHSKDK